MKPNPIHRLPAPLEAAVQRLKLAAREAAELAAREAREAEARARAAAAPPPTMIPRVRRLMRTSESVLTATRPTMSAVPRSGCAMISPSGRAMTISSDAASHDALSPTPVLMMAWRIGSWLRDSR